MPNVTLILETPNPGAYSIASALNDNAVLCGFTETKKGKTTVAPVIVGSDVVPVKAGVTGFVKPVTTFGDKWVCTVVAPRKPQTGILFDPVTSEYTFLEAPAGKGINLFPFWAEDVLLGQILDGTSNKRTGVWGIDGKLIEVLDGVFIGKANGQYVPFDASVDCPAPFAAPTSARVSRSNVAGHMYVDGKRTTANSCAWVQRANGVTVFANPAGVFGDATRFGITAISPDGRWIFGLAFNPDAVGQYSVAFDSETGTFYDQKTVFGVELSQIVFSDNAAFGIGTVDDKVGVCRVEGWGV